MRARGFRLRRLTVAALCTLALTACGGGGGGGGGGPDAPGTLGYTLSDVDYPVCAPIEPNAPIVSGGTPNSFSIEPPLPAGLTLDPHSGVISGAPSVTFPTTSFLVTAQNSAGRAVANLSIGVVSADPVGIDYGGPTATLYVGVQNSAVPGLASGFANTWSLVSGSLPPGITLDPATGELSGAVTFMPTSAVGSVQIRATNCTGAQTVASLQLQVEWPNARAAYVIHDAEAVLSSYAVDDASGLLRSRGWSETLDMSSSDLAVSPNGRWLFVAEGDTTSIRTYACGPIDCRATDTGSAVSTGALPAIDLAVHPGGRYLYAITNEGMVAQYALAPATGVLTPLMPALVPAGGEPSSLALHPRGAFAYVTDALDGEVACYRIDAGTGTLTHFADVPTGATPTASAISPDGAWLFVANLDGSSVSAYSIDGASGVLGPLAGSPFATTAGKSPMSLAVDRTSRFLYVAHGFEAVIEQFSIANGSGALSHLSPPAFVLDDPSSRIDRDPSGDFFYVFVHRSGWSVLTPAGNGALVRAASPTILGRHAPRAIAFQPSARAPAFSVANVYSASSDGRVFQFEAAPNGTLSALAPPSISAVGPAPRWVEPHESAGTAYVANQNASGGAALSICRVASTGALTLDATVGTQTSNHSVHVDPSGRFAYQVVGGSPGSVRAYSVDLATGALTALGSEQTGDGPRALAIHPNGRFVYVPCAAGDSIDLFELDWASGALVPVVTTLTGDSPVQVAIPESGTHLLCLEGSSSTVVVYGISSLDGTLSFMSAGFNDLGTGVSSFALDPLAEHVFASGVNGSLLVAYALDLSDGSLTPTGQQLNASSATSLRVDPRGRNLYATTAANRVQRFAYDPAAGFTAAESFAAGASPAGLGVRTLLR